MDYNNDLKIPLVIGVTGHRDIHEDDIDGLKSKIEIIFQSLIKKYEYTPMILLSPLADGADRIVAEVALDKFACYITVSVPLPFDEPTYKNTFGTNYDKSGNVKTQLRLTKEESIEEYDKLMAKVNDQKKSFVPKIIPMPYDGKNKNYSLVGEYIAIHSQILIALQNPCSEGASGGTAEIVNKKLSGEYIYVSDTQDNVSLLEKGLVYRILTPRIQDKERLKNCYKLTKIFPDNEERNWEDKKKTSLNKLKNVFIDTCTHLFSSPCLTKTQQESMNSFRQEHYKINCFNKEVNAKRTKILEEVESRDLKKIISLGITEKKWESNLEDVLLIKNIKTRRAAAFLSEKYQKYMHYFESILLSLIVFATFLFFVNLILPEYLHKYKTITYLGVIVLFYILNTYFQKYKNLHEDTRAISEGLRVQTAWKIANIKESVAFSYPSAQKNELNWIRTSLRALNIFHIPIIKAEEKVTCTVKKQVYDYWINEQISYFQKNIKKLSIQKENYEEAINFFIVFAVLFSLIFTLYPILCTILDPNYKITEEFKISKFFLVGIPFIALAFLKSKQAFNGYSKTIKQYELSLAHFSRAKTLFRKSSPSDTIEIYKSLGIEALQENTFWTILRREKSYKSPSL